MKGFEMYILCFGVGLCLVSIRGRDFFIAILCVPIHDPNKTP